MLGKLFITVPFTKDSKLFEMSAALRDWWLLKAVNFCAAKNGYCPFDKREMSVDLIATDGNVQVAVVRPR